jgi:glycosyltransferase involved in cell wall biosynthesis
VKRLRVLLSAYACEPDKGTEPEIGWNAANAMAQYHEVWVLTRANNRPAIEAALGRTPMRRLHFVYYDLKPWARWWKRGQRGVHLYYYLWQVGVHSVARRLHREVGFDLIHHMTIGKYWAPSLLALLPVPFVWGPVGGGESMPRSYWGNLSRHGKTYEILRDVGRWLGEHDPFVRLTARRSALALANTEETAERLRRLGAKDVRNLSHAGLRIEEIDHLAQCPLSNTEPVTFLSIGRLLAWKGFHLGLQAFARASFPLGAAEYWIIGNGPERKGLETLTSELGIADHVRFWGWLPREETLRKLRVSHVLVHPSLHDSAPGVCVEAMAAGRPVICLDLGGPATQVTAEAGVKVKAHDPEQAVRHLADAMRRLAQDSELREAMGRAGRLCSQVTYSWKGKGKLLDAIYADVVWGLSGHAGHPTHSRARECSPR